MYFVVCVNSYVPNCVSAGRWRELHGDTMVWYIDLFQEMKNREVLIPACPLHRFAVRFLASSLINADLQRYRRRWNGHAFQAYPGAKKVSPDDMMSLRGAPPGAVWTNRFMPISAAEVEALALANPIDVDAASERYMPAVVVQLFTAIEARTVPADQRAVSRANLGERLEALVTTAFAEAVALGGEFAQWTGVTRVDDE